jgi:hypothetical protein
MSEPRLPTICDLKFDFNEPTERKAAFAWLRIVAPVLTNVERQQLRQYLQALRRDERGECVIVLRGRKFGGRSCAATSLRSRAGPPDGRCRWGCLISRDSSCRALQSQNQFKSPPLDVVV